MRPPWLPFLLATSGFGSAACTAPVPASSTHDAAGSFDMVGAVDVVAPGGTDLADATYADSGPAPMFAADRVHTVAITVAPDAWSALLGNAKNPKLPRAFAKADVRIDGALFGSVGIRNFGDGSQQANPAKPNVRIKFDEYVAATRGPEKLKNLRCKAGGTEPTFLREPLFYEALRALGAPAPRWGFARITVNDVAYGACRTNVLSAPSCWFFLIRPRTG